MLMLSRSVTFLLRVVIFLDIHKKQGRSSSNSGGHKIQTKRDWKMYSRTYGAAVHKSNIRVKRWHNKYENSDDIFALFLVNLDFNVIH